MTRLALTPAAGRLVLRELARHPGMTVREATDRLGVAMETDPAVVLGWCRDALAEHPAEATRLRAGDTKLLGWFLGRLTKTHGPRLHPDMAKSALETLIAS